MKTLYIMIRDFFENFSDKKKLIRLYGFPIDVVIVKQDIIINGLAFNLGNSNWIVATESCILKAAISHDGSSGKFDIRGKNASGWDFVIFPEKK